MAAEAPEASSLINIASTDNQGHSQCFSKTVGQNQIMPPHETNVIQIAPTSPQQLNAVMSPPKEIRVQPEQKQGAALTIPLVETSLS